MRVFIEGPTLTPTDAKPARLISRLGSCKKGVDMIRKYIEAAMEHAKYEILKDDGTYYGEIKECPGVYSNAPALEKCRNELEEVLEEWILFRVYKNLEIPPIGNIEIKIKKQAVA
jgi:predicted RNase H-like HicB family nuclease